MNRNEIIDCMTKLFQDNPHVYAMWIEGSDANGNLDEFSDIDICADIDENEIANIFNEIHKFFNVDYSHEIKSGDDEIQLVFHVRGCIEYLMVDFSVYKHGKNHQVFVNGDKIDVCTIIFDKQNIISYKDDNPDDYQGDCNYWLEQGKFLFSQICRVKKYCLRGLFPEAYIYYDKYVISPIVFNLRRKYTPSKIWYYMIHISNHIPKQELDKLNKLLKVQSTEDILNNLDFAKDWFEELIKE